MKCVYARAANAPRFAGFPSFSATGSILGMKRLYYGADALLVRCGQYIYNVTAKPELYWRFYK